MIPFVAVTCWSNFVGKITLYQYPFSVLHEYTKEISILDGHVSLAVHLSYQPTCTSSYHKNHGYRLKHVHY